MALYTIGEVAQLCDINPVTLRAWQRRYELIKPQRTDGGHRLFNDNEIERIREIKRWIDAGVQVSKVKTCYLTAKRMLKTAGADSRRYCSVFYRKVITNACAYG